MLLGWHWQLNKPAPPMTVLFSAEGDIVTHLNWSGQKNKPMNSTFFVPNGCKKPLCMDQAGGALREHPRSVWTQRVEFCCQQKMQGRTKCLWSSQMCQIGLLNWTQDQLRACCSTLTLSTKEALKCAHLFDGWIKQSIHSICWTTAAMLLCS